MFNDIEQNESTESAPLDPSSSAHSELAALLADEQNINSSEIKEEPVELASEIGESKTSWAVVIPALAAVLAVIVFGLGFPGTFTDTANVAFTWILDNLGWALVLFSTIFVAFVLVIGLSQYGEIKLGAADEEPEFTTIS